MISPYVPVELRDNGVDLDGSTGTAFPDEPYGVDESLPAEDVSPAVVPSDPPESVVIQAVNGEAEHADHGEELAGKELLIPQERAVRDDGEKKALIMGKGDDLREPAAEHRLAAREVDGADQAALRKVADDVLPALGRQVARLREHGEAVAAVVVAGLGEVQVDLELSLHEVLHF